jgi:hypothetical protein
MCRHCERITEDLEYKDIVHKFMDGVARGVNRANDQRGLSALRVDPDDLEVRIEARIQPTPRLSFESNAAVNRLIFKHFLEAFE